MTDLNQYIKKSHLKAVEKFNEELQAWAKETGEQPVELFENPFVSFRLANVRVVNGDLVYEYDGKEEKEMVVCTDEETGELYETEYDGIMDYIKFWRACLRRAKRYWSMPVEKLDAIQDGKVEDIEDTED